ncbi:MAG: response regulator [Bdellovibrionales bacterium]
MNGSQDGKYILVVDDDPTMQLVLQGMIEKAGFKPVIAENGEKAIQFFEIGGDNIGVVLVDRHMPDMDGFEVIKALNDSDQHFGIPVIMQSGSKTPQDIRDAIDHGVFYYLTKPFALEALQYALEFSIEKAKMRDAVRERVDHGFTPANMMLSSSFELRTMDEARSLAVLL